MKLKKQDLIKNLLTYLKGEHPNDFIFKSSNPWFDICISTMGKDILYKIILEGEFSRINPIINFLKKSTFKNSFVRKKYFVALYQKTGSFKFIEIL